MRALDTNILARFIVRDDETQFALAEAALSGPCYIADTVLLELAWLLTSRFALDRSVVGMTMADLLDLPTVSVSDRELLEWAIGRFLDGADFADVMHLVGSRHSSSFATFEKRLDRIAGPDTPVPIERLQ